ncbi:MAG: hypothetical protein MRY63_10655 [Neomegalonema sp.]|nr:hypothetical protein [Neomegalonema sp.]
MIAKKVIIGLALASSLGLAGCRTLAPVENVSDAPFGITASQRSMALSDYEKAIIRAGSNRGWVFKRIAPGQLEASVNVRGKHSAVVDIYYNTKTYSIRYKGSENLKYDPATNTIHPNYNQWIHLLEQEINTEIQKL